MDLKIVAILVLFVSSIFGGEITKEDLESISWNIPRPLKFGCRHLSEDQRQRLEIIPLMSQAIERIILKEHNKRSVILDIYESNSKHKIPSQLKPFVFKISSGLEGLVKIIAPNNQNVPFCFAVNILIDLSSLERTKYLENLSKMQKTGQKYIEIIDAEIKMEVYFHEMKQFYVNELKEEVSFVPAPLSYNEEKKYYQFSLIVIPKSKVEKFCNSILELENNYEVVSELQSIFEKNKEDISLISLKLEMFAELLKGEFKDQEQSILLIQKYIKNQLDLKEKGLNGILDKYFLKFIEEEKLLIVNPVKFFGQTLINEFKTFGYELSIQFDYEYCHCTDELKTDCNLICHNYFSCISPVSQWHTLKPEFKEYLSSFELNPPKKLIVNPITRKGIIFLVLKAVKI